MSRHPCCSRSLQPNPRSNASYYHIFDTNAVVDAHCRRYGPRQKQVPSWCKDSPYAKQLRGMGEEGEKLAREAALELEDLLGRGTPETDDAGPAPPPLPQCPNMLDRLAETRRLAEELELERELGLLNEKRD